MLLSVTEVALYSFCPFFMLLSRFFKSKKAREGLRAHKNVLRKLELGRDLWWSKKLRLDGWKLEFESRIENRELGLCGRIDVLATKQRRAIPIELKNRGRLELIDMVQISGYALLLQGEGYEVRGGKIVLLKARKDVDVSLSARTLFMKSLRELKGLRFYARKENCEICPLSNFCDPTLLERLKMVYVKRPWISGGF